MASENNAFQPQLSETSIYAVADEARQRPEQRDTEYDHICLQSTSFSTGQSNENQSRQDDTYDHATVMTSVHSAHGGITSHAIESKGSRKISRLQILILVCIVLTLVLAVTGIAIMMQEKRKLEDALKTKRFEIANLKQATTLNLTELKENLKSMKREIKVELGDLIRKQVNNFNATSNLTDQIKLLRKRLDKAENNINLLQREVRISKPENKSGLVEVLYEGIWGTICDTNWDLDDATVVCRMLGFNSSIDAPKGAHFGKGSGKIWLNNVECTGSEDTLLDCQHDGWGDTGLFFYCGHDRDASVVCE